MVKRAIPPRTLWLFNDITLKMPPGRPVVGATLVVARLRSAHIFMFRGAGGNRHERLVRK